MLGAYQQHVESQLHEIRGAGLWKPERILDSPQRPEARLHGGQRRDGTDRRRKLFRGPIPERVGHPR